MTKQAAEPADMPQTEAAIRTGEDDSVKSTFARLYHDGRRYADAELNRQKLRAAILANGVRNAVIFVITSLILVFAGIIALLVGLVIALTPLFGALWAALLIFGATMIVAIILLWFAKTAITRMKRAIAP